MITPEMIDRLVREEPGLKTMTLEETTGRSMEEKKKIARETIPEEDRQLFTLLCKSPLLMEKCSEGAMILLKEVGVPVHVILTITLRLMDENDLLFSKMITPWLVGINIGYKLAQAELVEETLKRI